MHNQRLRSHPTDIPRHESSRIIGRPARADRHGGGRVVTERNVNDTCVILDVPAQDDHSMDVSCGSSVSIVYVRRVNRPRYTRAHTLFEAGRRSSTRSKTILFSSLFHFRSLLMTLFLC